MPQQSTRITVPDGIGFADLRLARDASGHVSFSWAPVEAICAASGIDIALLRDGPEDNVSALIAAWYAAHIQQGGAADPTQEDLIAEIQAEDALGGGLSHQPGRA